MASSISVTAHRRTGASAIEKYLGAVHASRSAHPYLILVGLDASDTTSLHQRLGSGLSYGTFDKLIHLLALPAHAGADALLIPHRTLQRRRAEGRLQPDESDRLVRLLRLFGKAIELFEGDGEAARSWLGSPAEALGGATPLEMSRTEPGARDVEFLIGRLEHGVFS